MKKTKIWIVCNWDEIYDSNVAERAKRNWPMPDNLELDPVEYEYLLVLGGFKGNDFSTFFKDPEKTIGFLMEPEWSSNWQKNLHRLCKYVVCQNHDMFPGNNTIVHPLFMFTQSTDDYSFYQSGNFEKKHRMSIISSNYGHKFNYIKRHELFKGLLSTGLDVHFFGRDWNLQDSRYKGAPHNKSEGIVNYQYSIAIENSSYDNYLTEKFFDCIVCDTIPIYYGCTNTEKIYPTESFIELDFSGPIEKTVEQVTRIYNIDDYSKRISSLAEAKNLYYTKYNIFSFLNNLINEGKI
jgi:hypothetical protein